REGLRRDHGSKDGDRKLAADQLVPPGAGLHPRVPHRERLYRGEHRPLHRRAGRGGPRPPPDIVPQQRSRAGVHQAPRQGGRGVDMNSRRRWMDGAWLGLALASVVLALAPLASIIYYVAVRGVAAISVTFLTHLPAPPDFPGGGVGNALQGTLIMVVLASALGVPV